MTLMTSNSQPTGSDEKMEKLDPGNPGKEITELDVRIFKEITDLAITTQQKARVATPTRVFPSQKFVMAVHWHPEHIPMGLIRQRIDNTFPGKQDELIIPTQHNRLMSYDGQYSGVEVDCYSRGFKRKVQLLLHFKTDKLERADTLKLILNHTFKYRSSQVFELMETLINPKWDDYLQLAAEGTGVNEKVVNFARIHAGKLREQLRQNQSAVSAEIIKNRLVSDYIEAQRALFPDNFINKVQVFVKHVKKIVKDNFSLNYFYRTSEVIEEARSLGGGIVVPHPEQFWPILLCDYDVDGYEVWNPQSQEYTEFLINVINRQNKSMRFGNKKLLLFMGDDTHLSEKIKDPTHIEASKYYRDIGVQPAWEDLSIKQSLIMGDFSPEKMIKHYRDRLNG